LGKYYEVDIWEKDTVFGLGQVTIEALEAAVLKYDIGIFVFTPDDKLLSRGDKRPVARDNVIFESGLFIASCRDSRLSLSSRQRIVSFFPATLKVWQVAMFDPPRKQLPGMIRPAVNRN